MTNQMKTDYRNRPVGEVVAEDYARAAVFKRLGIDFCCGGGQTVQKACDRVGISYESLEEELESVSLRGDESGWVDPRGWDLDLLTAYIEKTHHRYVRKALPILDQFSEKVARVHGGNHPELLAVRALVEELSGEMERHMADEERDLFPRIAGMVESTEAAASDTMEALVAALEEDHDHAGGIMRQIRELTSDYAPPQGACATYRATFAMLEEFEEDLHRHVHLENNILFPRAAALQARMGREGKEPAHA